MRRPESLLIFYPVFLVFPALSDPCTFRSLHFQIPALSAFPSFGFSSRFSHCFRLFVEYPSSAATQRSVRRRNRKPHPATAWSTASEAAHQTASSIRLSRAYARLATPRTTRQTRLHPLRPARTRDTLPMSRRASTHTIRFRIHSALSARRRLPGQHTKVSISPVRAAMLRDCSKKVSTSRANGNLDEILRFLDASSMMVSHEKAWKFNDS